MSEKPVKKTIKKLKNIVEKKIITPLTKVDTLISLIKKRNEKKKQPIKSVRPINKELPKLLVESFLSKDRPKTILQEKIESRRIKTALKKEYNEYKQKADKTLKEALKKNVTKSTDAILFDKIEAEENLKKKNETQKDSVKELLDYIESQQTLEQLLKRIPEYVDASKEAKKEIHDLVKISGYRDLAKQKLIVKKFLGGTPAQRQLQIQEVESTPKAKLIKVKIAEEKEQIKQDLLDQSILAVEAKEQAKIAVQKKKEAEKALKEADKLKIKAEKQAEKDLITEKEINDRKATGKKLLKDQLLYLEEKDKKELALQQKLEDEEKSKLADKAKNKIIKLAELFQKKQKTKVDAIITEKKSEKAARLAQEAEDKRRIEIERIILVDMEAKETKDRLLETKRLAKEKKDIDDLDASIIFKKKEGLRLTNEEKARVKFFKDKSSKLGELYKAKLSERKDARIQAIRAKRETDRLAQEETDRLAREEEAARLAQEEADRLALLVPVAPPIVPVGEGFNKMNKALIGKKDQYLRGNATLKRNEKLNQQDDDNRKSQKLVIPKKELAIVERYNNMKKQFKNV